MADTPDLFFAVLTVFVSMGASIISGMAGGGSGFIIAPFFMFMGLPPGLATATAKMNEVGVNTSSILAMRTVKRRVAVTQGAMVMNINLGMPANFHRQMLFLGLFTITMVNVVLAAWLIPRLNAEGAQYVISGLLLFMIPTLFMDKKAFKPGYRTKKIRRSGYVMYSVVSFFQALFGMGIGMFISMVLMYLFGISVTEANDMKRRLMIFQAVILTVLLLAQGAIVLYLGLAALLGALVGGHIGTNIGVKKGTGFIKKIMAVVMFASAMWLLFGQA